MKALLFAGIIYLIVIAIVLIIKPKFMFTEDGVWKEFGIGRNPATHTWLPFWLFAILWALISYIFVIIVLSIFEGKSDDTSADYYASSASSKRGKQMPRYVEQDSSVYEITTDDILHSQQSVKQPSKSQMRARARGKSLELPNGYYILNSEATEAAGGIPKYIFLGKGLPEDS
jgi:hypothetical protein